MHLNVLQMLSWLSPAPVGLEECMQSEPKHLKALFLQHKAICDVDNQNWAKGSTTGNAHRKLKFQYHH